MVESIEDLFVPVLIYNNKKQDAAILKAFNEPSWNNPVSRFLDKNGSDVIPRKDGQWTIAQVAGQMVAALKASNRDVPNYLSSLTTHGSKLQKATFAMHCYWEGEGKLGSINGVSDTRSAWLGGLEVVDVIYDPDSVDYAKLVKTAQSFNCASKVFANSPGQLKEAKKLVGNNAVPAPGNSRLAKRSDQKYYLRNTPVLSSLPLTRFQSTKVNAAIKNGKDYSAWLSPRQLTLLAKLQKLSARTLQSFEFPEDDSKLASYLAKLKLVAKARK